MKIRCFLAAFVAVLVVAVPPAAAGDRVPSEDPAEQAARLVSGLRDKDPEVRARAALDAAACQHPSLLKPLLRLLGDPEQGVREAATQALATREDKGEKKKAAAGLNPRLARLSRKASDQAELLVVIAALDKLAQPSSIKPLLDDIDIDTAPEVAQARFTAVAGIPHKDAVDRLIQFLAKGRKRGRHNDAASKALQYATGQRFGRDPDRWRAWWRENEKSFDFEAFAKARAEADAERRAKADRRKERRAKKDGGGKKKRDGEKKGDKKKADD